MFGFIKKLIGGIFGFLGGLFGKKNEFYLELKEEAGETAAAPAPAPKAEPATVTTAEPVKAEKAQPAKVEKAKPAKPEPVKAAKAEPAPAAETTFAPKYLLSTGSSSRRRPGANMNSFLDMARQVKVPG
ncbi:MAG: hypothetical protein EAZ76_10985 [Nostocales cyanobacterium]|nr:MAG: hypothetical protein EAZ87_01410 [Nostocales cyanobacterium]TAF13718.1 MAG: hypothetical protein EAZ76_10985 [Nostocales cyanobacterium]